MIEWFEEPPELRYMRDKEVRARYLWQALGRFRQKYRAREKRFYNALFLSMFCTPALVPRGSWWVCIIIAPLLWTLGSWLYWRRNRKRLRFCLREVISESGEICVSCGYSIQGNRTGVCPECGSLVTHLENDPGKPREA